MNRAGLFIGVNRTGTLEPLHDAVGCAKRMHAWALAQGMVDKTTAILITDDDKKRVTGQDVKDAVDKLLEVASLDQLIVYFAGHGVVINRSENWLLTDAPKNPNAAINLASSVWLARYCSVSHVIFISDACRLAPIGIQAQNMVGQDIFPNIVNTEAHFADELYATSVGKPAAEVTNPAQTTKEFRSLFTDALLQALTQPREEAVDPAIPSDRFRYIRPKQLASHLKREVTNLIIERKLAGKVDMDPEAILPSYGADPPVENWLARFESSAATTTQPPSVPGIPKTMNSFSAGVLDDLLKDDVVKATAEIQGGLRPGLIKVARRAGPDWQTFADAEMAGVKRVARTAEDLRNPFGTDHFETGCGVKVRGRAIAQCFAAAGAATFNLLPPDTVRVNQIVNGSAANLLIRFEDKSATLVPVIPEFIAALTFTSDGLADIAYEPSGPVPQGLPSERYQRFLDRAEQIRPLRAVAASMSQHGRFHIEGKNAEQLARKMQYAKGVDPGLALYAAYAYNDLQLTDRIAEMSGYLRYDIRMTFFDIELLCGRLLDRSFDIHADPQKRAAEWIMPCFPMLSQGWNYVGPNRIQLPKVLLHLEKKLEPSLWTLFNAAGGDLLQIALEKGELR